MYEVLSTKYLPSSIGVGHSKLVSIPYFACLPQAGISYFVLSITTWYLVLPFDILHWTFSVRHWLQFRISPAYRRQVYRISYFLSLLGTWYFPSTFCTGRSAFDIGFNSVFRLPTAGRYLVSRTFYPYPLL